jgi:hypothetical protein
MKLELKVLVKNDEGFVEVILLYLSFVNFVYCVYSFDRKFLAESFI